MTECCPPSKLPVFHSSRAPRTLSTAGNLSSPEASWFMANLSKRLYHWRKLGMKSRAYRWILRLHHEKVSQFAEVSLPWRNRPHATCVFRSCTVIVITSDSWSVWEQVTILASTLNGNDTKKTWEGLYKLLQPTVPFNTVCKLMNSWNMSWWVPMSSYTTVFKI